jgi:voltage-gated potassium channel
MDPLRNVLFSLLTLVVLIGGGTVGYGLIEGWTAFESLYMTVITLATVGYKEVYELSFEGKIFTIILIISGTGTIAYTIGSMVQFMVEGQLRKRLGRKKVQKQISNLKDHYIVCGYGRIGRSVCREFASKPIPFIVVEQNQECCQILEEEGHLYVQGDATHDDILEKAGIRKELGLIIVGIKRDNQMSFNPDPSIEITAGDILIALGESPEIKNLEVIASGAA